MKKKLIIFWCWILLTICVNNLFAQNVSNVKATQVGNAIEITYDLDKAANISVFISTNGGSTFRGLQKVSGDVGETVGPGHKTISWDVLAEVDSLVGDSIVFRVRVEANAEAAWRKQQRKAALKAMPYSTFFTLNGAYGPIPQQWSYGFKVGQMKIAGWYVSFMTNFNFKGMKHPFEDDHIYALDGTTKTVRISAQAGLVVRPCKPMSLLFGVGYGYRTFTCKTTDGEWFSYPRQTYEGIDASFGFLFDIKGFVLSAEAVTTNFQTVEAKVGLGFCLPHNKKNKTLSKTH